MKKLKISKDKSGGEVVHASPFVNDLHSLKDHLKTHGSNFYKNLKQSPLGKYASKVKEKITSHPAYEKTKDFLSDFGYEVASRAKEELESTKIAFRPYTKEEKKILNAKGPVKYLH